MMRKLFSCFVFLYGGSILYSNAFKNVPPTAARRPRPCRHRQFNLQMVPLNLGNADWLLSTSSSTWISDASATVADTANDDTGLLSNRAIIATFVVGLIPFAVATVEFWRRIAVGDSFGTGSDSVVIIGEDDAPLSSRGRRVLGKGALVTAYILFGLAASVLAIVLYAVVTSSAPENVAANLPSSTQ